MYFLSIEYIYNEEPFPNPRRKALGIILYAYVSSEHMTYSYACVLQDMQSVYHKYLDRRPFKRSPTSAVFSNHRIGSSTSTPKTRRRCNYVRVPQDPLGFTAFTVGGHGKREAFVPPSSHTYGHFVSPTSNSQQR
jgi:hypothetical protein